MLGLECRASDVLDQPYATELPLCLANMTDLVFHLVLKNGLELTIAEGDLEILILLTP